MPKISVIIPVHPDETAHEKLIQFFDDMNDPDLDIIISNGSNRANAMNNGVQKSKYDILWFVHADTTLTDRHIPTLKNALSNHPDRIHYFDLAFDSDGPWLVKLNALGANIRSGLFGFPWGDQAIAMPKQVFEKLGSYNETLPYGEDHALMIKARQKKIKLHRISLALQTSSRQYKEIGWLSLTLKRQYLWFKLTMQEILK